MDAGRDVAPALIKSLGGLPILFFLPLKKLSKFSRHGVGVSWYMTDLSDMRPIYIGKNQNPKNLGFLLYCLHCQKKPITSGFFGTKSVCAKNPESHTGVLVSGAHARLLSTFDRTRVVRITSRAMVG